jgi:hypothetical protein
MRAFSLDKDHEGRLFERSEKKLDDFIDACIVINPLWKCDLIKGEAVPAPESMDSGGATLFFRHPMYQTRLKKHSPVFLDESDSLILYWASRLRTVRQISSILKLDTSFVWERLERMESKELVQIQNISLAMADCNLSTRSSNYRL